MRMFHGNTAGMLGESQQFLGGLTAKCLDRICRQVCVAAIYGFSRAEMARNKLGFSPWGRALQGYSVDAVSYNVAQDHSYGEQFCSSSAHRRSR